MINDLMEDFGFEPGRFSISWVSSAESDRFVEAVTAMTQQVRGLGPNPLGQAEEHVS